MTFDFSGLAISILSSHNLLLPLACYFPGSLCTIYVYVSVFGLTYFQLFCFYVQRPQSMQ